MKRVMKEAMGDCSTTGEFRFLVRCQECGSDLAQQPRSFFQSRRGAGDGGDAHDLPRPL